MNLKFVRALFLLITIINYASFIIIIKIAEGFLEIIIKSNSIVLNYASLSSKIYNANMAILVKRRIIELNKCTIQRNIKKDFALIILIIQ